MNSSLKLFTQADVLQQIGMRPLQTFLSHFADSDPQFASLAPDSPYYFSELSRLFTLSLSQRVSEILALLEHATSPEHCDRLAAIAQQKLPNLSGSEFHPLALALELWLAFPDDLSPFDGSAGRAATSPLPAGQGQDQGEGLVVSDHFGSCPSIQESINPLIQSCEQHTTTSLLHHSNPSLLDSLRSLLARYVILPEHAAETLALWIVHTYAFELRHVTTYLGLESPVRRCGKSTLLNVLSRLVNRPLVAANVSPSALYRAIEELRPTLMIDEADTFLRPNDELTGILNAGYHRATAYVIRVQNSKPEARNSKQPAQSRAVPSSSNPFNPCNSSASLPSPVNSFNSCNPFNPCNSITSYSCWCPKVIARIGRLPETLADRCILIKMQRKTPKDQCERLRDLETADLCRQCAQFVEANRETITSAKPSIPSALNDRAADIWEPLLAIADCAGGDWPARAREAALALSSDTRENNPVGSLLLDIFLLFATSGQDRIPTRALVEALNTQFPDRPWMETRQGQRSTEMWLSEQLRPFGINPRTFRSQNSILRGYDRDDFAEVFRRYIPATELDALRTLAERRLSEKDQQ